ncbi:hypothetical protein AB0H88_18790 [Nonomuraea sp. NPDC050680]|uniref:hypothetical protein n=1 Tax=Nonomuraea sp. NPDC050680 TaxID=3154630 RepID=UPI0033D831EF
MTDDDTFRPRHRLPRYPRCVAGIGGHLVDPNPPQPPCSICHEVLSQRDPGRVAGCGQIPIQQSGQRSARQLDEAHVLRTGGERRLAIGFICHGADDRRMPDRRPTIFE